MAALMWFVGGRGRGRGGRGEYCRALARGAGWV